MRGKPWSDDEIATLRAVVEAGAHPRTACEHIPDRGADACQQMAAKLGMHPTRQRIVAEPRHHDDDIQFRSAIMRASDRFALDGLKVLRGEA